LPQKSHLSVDLISKLFNCLLVTIALQFNLVWNDLSLLSTVQQKLLVYIVLHIILQLQNFIILVVGKQNQKRVHVRYGQNAQIILSVFFPF